MKLYKYVHPDTVPRVFGPSDTVLLRCSLPKEFNDPYELFLTVDYNLKPALLAYYQDIVGEIVQTPTACFSRAPDVVPMWAHYGREGSGAVIEFDEDCLTSEYPECAVDDIEYRDEADPTLTQALEFAARTLKPRHAAAFGESVLRGAYFTKASAWSYERERRMVVVRPDYLEKRDGRRFLVVHNKCVTGLIGGPDCPAELRELLRERAAALDCPYYDMVIGRLTPRPYFNGAADPHVFDGYALTPATYICDQCGEPLGAPGDTCSWCGLSDDERTQAAMDNPLRLLGKLGLLDEYMSARKTPTKSTTKSGR
jgi:hypothetical protein